MTNRTSEGRQQPLVGPTAEEVVEEIVEMAQGLQNEFPIASERWLRFRVRLQKIRSRLRGEICERPD